MGQGGRQGRGHEIFLPTEVSVMRWRLSARYVLQAVLPQTCNEGDRGVTNEELLQQDNMLWTHEGRKRILALMDKARAEAIRDAVRIVDACPLEVGRGHQRARSLSHQAIRDILVNAIRATQPATI